MASSFSILAITLSNSESSKIFFQSSLMMVSLPYWMAISHASENGLEPRARRLLAGLDAGQTGASA
jgi:hypothetical protein